MRRPAIRPPEPSRCETQLQVEPGPAAIGRTGTRQVLHSVLVDAAKRYSRLAAIASLWLLTGCAVLNHGMLAAGGPVMDQQRHLFIIVSIVMLFVIGPVLLITPISAWHYRLSNTKSAYHSEWSFN